MKSIMNRNKIVGVFLGATLLTACSNSWLEEYTEDPTRPIDVGADVLLTSAETFYVLSHGDALPRLTSIFMQQMTGTDRQSLAHNRYAQIGESDFDSPWGLAGYGGGMYDLKLIIDKANADGAPHYSGVAKILMAQYLGLLTDHFGDIPYSEAFQGADNLNPAFDSQQDIYNTIFTLLSEGRTEVTAATSAYSPGSDDLLYSGDLDAWENFAWALEARYKLHLSKTAGFNATEVTTAANNAISGGFVDAEFMFAASDNQSNPWYQFTSVDRNGYITQYGYMYDNMMVPNNDPRLPLYRSADSLSMPFYGSQTSPLPYMTEYELLFILAEMNPTLATLTAAVQANMDYLGVSAADAATYIATLPAVPTLEDVMNEKYIAMFSQNESWTDWRRTGFPAITVYPGANLSDIPRRLPYPEDEYLYNSANVPMPLGSTPEEKFGVATTYRLWWDQ